MKGTIEINDMEFWAYHGCYDLEKVVGNRFLVDVSIDAELGEAAAGDDIDATINYLTVYEIVASQMKIASDTIENVALRALDAICGRFPQALFVKVKVSKMAPSLGGKVGRASVTVTR